MWHIALAIAVLLRKAFRYCHGKAISYLVADTNKIELFVPEGDYTFLAWYYDEGDEVNKVLNGDSWEAADELYWLADNEEAKRLSKHVSSGETLVLPTAGL